MTIRTTRELGACLAEYRHLNARKNYGDRFSPGEEFRLSELKGAVLAYIGRARLAPCAHLYQAKAVIRGGTGGSFGRASDRDVETWVYQCMNCGHRFQTDNNEFNKDARL